VNETRDLASFVCASRWSDIPLDIRHEGKRALLNWLACALGGCTDKTVESGCSKPSSDFQVLAKRTSSADAGSSTRSTPL
jgi:2-methylcitrate dehydratase PrpD